MVSPTTQQTRILRLGTGAGREVDSRVQLPPLIAVFGLFSVAITEQHRLGGV